MQTSSNPATDANASWATPLVRARIEGFVEGMTRNRWVAHFDPSEEGIVVSLCPRDGGESFCGFSPEKGGYGISGSMMGDVGPIETLEETLETIRDFYDER